MNKPLSAADRQSSVLSTTAVMERISPPAAPTMTRRDKLLRWGDLIRACPHGLILFNNLEHMPPDVWDTIAHPHSAFALAANDPDLRAAGLKGEFVGDAVRFFELSRDEVHAFSCDCGGAISNAQMAGRIDAMAEGKAQVRAAPSMFAPAMAAIGSLINHRP